MLKAFNLLTRCSEASIKNALNISYILNILHYLSIAHAIKAIWWFKLKTELKTKAVILVNIPD